MDREVTLEQVQPHARAEMSLIRKETVRVQRVGGLEPDPMGTSHLQRQVSKAANVGLADTQDGSTKGGSIRAGKWQARSVGQAMLGGAHDTGQE